MIDRMRRSSIAGTGRLEAERSSYTDKLTAERLGEILEIVFREILPEYGYAVREDRIALAYEMLDTIRDRYISLFKTAEQMSKVCGIGEAKLRELMDRREIEFIQNGNRRLLADDAIWDWYNRTKICVGTEVRG